MEDAPLYKVVERGACRPDGKRLAIGITAAADEIADLDAMIAAKIVIEAPKPDLAPGRKTAYTVYEVEKIREEYEAEIARLQTALEREKAETKKPKGNGKA